MNITNEKPISVLLVDDDPETRNIFQMILEHHHMLIHVADNAETAFDYLAKNSPDVIVLDVFLPGMDGYQAFTQIRQNALAPTSRIIATTSYYTTETRSEVMERGFNGYLPKPLNISTLVSYLQEVAKAEVAKPQN